MATLDTEFILKRAAAKKLENVRTLNCWGSNLEDVSWLNIVMYHKLHFEPSFIFPVPQYLCRSIRAMQHYYYLVLVRNTDY